MFKVMTMYHWWVFHFLDVGLSEGDDFFNPLSLFKLASFASPPMMVLTFPAVGWSNRSSIALVDIVGPLGHRASPSSSEKIYPTNHGG